MRKVHKELPAWIDKRRRQMLLHRHRRRTTKCYVSFCHFQLIRADNHASTAFGRCARLLCLARLCSSSSLVRPCRACNFQSNARPVQPLCVRRVEATRACRAHRIAVEFSGKLQSITALIASVNGTLGTSLITGIKSQKN